MRWYHLAYMKLAVVLIIFAFLAEAKTTPGQVCAIIALLAVIVDLAAESHQEEE